MIAPYISREDVSAALSALIHHSRKPEFNGLRHLLLVDLRLVSPEMPDGDTVREYAIRELLVEEITEALTEQRANFSLPPPDDHANLHIVRVEASQAVEQGAYELMVWSLLYYRCVRADLDLSVDSLVSLLTLHERTISRYFSDGVDLLTERLIRAEEQARREQLARRLYAALPYSAPLRLFGREELLRSVENALGRLSPRHILITGAAGIGKTLFVEELIRRQIAAENLDHLIWIDQPESVDFVRQRIAETLLREDGQVALREYLLLYRVAFVLDGIERIAGDHALSSLLRDISASLVCLINRVFLPLEGVNAHIDLPEIDPQAAAALIVDLLPGGDVRDKRDVAAELYERVGGNPLLLKLMVGLWEAGDDEASIEHELHAHLFGRLFNQLNEPPQQAWCALALSPSAVKPDMLTRTWGISANAVQLLWRHGLVEVDNDQQFRLVDAAREFIRQSYFERGAVRRIVDDLIAQIADISSSFEVIEHTLASGFPEITPEKRFQWVSASWQEGLRRNHWALWRAVLQEQISQLEMLDPELSIAYAICLRRLSEWDAAEQVLRYLVAECGRHGLFAGQGRALVEWSILAKVQGNYREARAMISQAKRYAQRARNTAMLSELAQHEAQLLILQGDGQEAAAMLEMQPESLRVITLQSEAQLVLGNYTNCRALVERALKLVTGDQASEASLYTIYGRSFQEQGAFQQARPPLTDAVSILERLDDSFSLARAQTNLAAVLIPLGRLTDAGLLLARAEQIQLRLGDRVGLMATRHNRTLLGKHF